MVDLRLWDVSKLLVDANNVLFWASAVVEESNDCCVEFMEGFTKVSRLKLPKTGVFNDEVTDKVINTVEKEEVAEMKTITGSCTTYNKHRHA